MYYIIASFIIILVLLFIFYKLYEINNNLISKPDLVNNKLPPNGSQKIPKIIIQTWKTHKVPQRYMELIDTIKSLNPDYEYLFFTDESIEDFFKTHYPEYYNTYKKLPIKIQRIDFFRYVAVYHYGGFYMDLDMNAIKPFDDLLGCECIFPVDEYINGYMCNAPRYKHFCEKGYNFLLGQYAFAAKPKHPFIKKIIDKINDNINNYIKNVNFDSENYVYVTTGPDYVTNLYMYEPNKENIFILDNGKRQYFGDYAKHNYFGTWK